MMTNTEIRNYDYLVECDFFTTEELNLVRCIVSGSWTDVINMAIYARYGYRDFDSFMESLEDEDC